MFVFYHNLPLLTLWSLCAILFLFQIDQAAAMAAKLKRKAELQKQAARPQSFGENFKGEIQKQKEFGQQTKEERRAAMCEELGRGC